jgi:hypothetical protein
MKLPKWITRLLAKWDKASKEKWRERDEKLSRFDKQGSDKDWRD